MKDFVFRMMMNAAVSTLLVVLVAFVIYKVVQKKRQRTLRRWWAWDERRNVRLDRVEELEQVNVWIAPMERSHRYGW